LRNTLLPIHLAKRSQLLRMPIVHQHEVLRLEPGGWCIRIIDREHIQDYVMKVAESLFSFFM